MLNLKLVIHTFCLSLVVVIATTSAQADSPAIADSSKVLKFDNSKIVEDDAEFELPELNKEKTELAEALHNRVFNLYPASYYQRIFATDAHESALKDDKISLQEKQVSHCEIAFYKRHRYEKYAKYYAYYYVAETTTQDIQEDLQMLDYFFIEALAQKKLQIDLKRLDDNLTKGSADLVQNKSFFDISADFEEKIKLQGLESAYAEFLTSPRYSMLRGLAALEIEEGQAYSPLLFAFSLSSIQYCVMTYRNPTL